MDPGLHASSSLSKLVPMRGAIALFLLLLLHHSATAGWQAIELPTEESSKPTWLRCRIQVPDRLTVPEGNNPRDLWRSSTMLVLADLPGRAEVFLNGKSIIVSNNIPIGASRRFKIPKKNWLLAPLR